VAVFIPFNGADEAILMSGNEFDGGGSRYVCGVGFDVVLWRYQVYDGEYRVAV
jgi:hypothetical protein